LNILQAKHAAAGDITRDLLFWTDPATLSVCKRADVLCGLASVKTASALLSKTEWPRGLEEELCSRMTFAESATNVSWPGKLENYLRPYAKLVLA